MHFQVFLALSRVLQFPWIVEYTNCTELNFLQDYEAILFLFRLGKMSYMSEQLKVR
jgi:hypothetical protein